jgi:hypothetical protein
MIFGVVYFNIFIMGFPLSDITELQIFFLAKYVRAANRINNKKYNKNIQTASEKHGKNKINCR